MSNCFVFVVCGASEHIRELHFSLAMLRHFSRHKIIVVTDSSRNEEPVRHDTITDVRTPSHFNHHQASIFLKTNLFNILNPEPGALYCYLDTDVVAVSPLIDTVFDYYTPPVAFASDHCSFEAFSPYAMHCGCLEQSEIQNLEYLQITSFFEKLYGCSIHYQHEEKDALEKLFSQMRLNNPAGALRSFLYFFKRYVLPLRTFKLGSFTFDRKQRVWYNTRGDMVHNDFDYFASLISKEMGIRFDKQKKIWLNKKNQIISPGHLKCGHLSAYIKEKHNISIPYGWRHHNGGVFLFGHESGGFLNTWHKLTVDEFGNPATRTRDQATLAITVWLFGLEKNKPLPEEFNFIAEYGNPGINYKRNFGFTRDGFITSCVPAALHIYHEWGHRGWPIWDYAEALHNSICQTNPLSR